MSILCVLSSCDEEINLAINISLNILGSIWIYLYPLNHMLQRCMKVM